MLRSAVIARKIEGYHGQLFPAKAAGKVFRVNDNLIPSFREDDTVIYFSVTFIATATSPPVLKHPESSHGLNLRKI